MSAQGAPSPPPPVSWYRSQQCFRPPRPEKSFPLGNAFSYRDLRARTPIEFSHLPCKLCRPSPPRCFFGVRSDSPPDGNHFEADLDLGQVEVLLNCIPFRVSVFSWQYWRFFNEHPSHLLSLEHFRLPPKIFSLPPLTDWRPPSLPTDDALCRNFLADPIPPDCSPPDWLDFAPPLLHRHSGFLLVVFLECRDPFFPHRVFFFFQWSPAIEPLGIFFRWCAPSLA